MRQLTRATPLFTGLAEPTTGEVHGEVHTRRWVVELILDLVDYTPDRDLSSVRMVEPACGHGAFLEAIAERVSRSCRLRNQSLRSAKDSVRALDLLPANVAASREAVRRVLVSEGWDRRVSSEISRAWVRQGDYLLDDSPDLSDVDVVVGNPPYIRLEDVPEQRMRLYRETCQTMTGRSDVYVGFFETALTSLTAEGRLGFICADRWMRNQYGRDLRRLVCDNGSVDAIITMHDVDVFYDQVSAYPAITLLRRGSQGVVAAARADRSFGADHAPRLLKWIEGEELGLESEGFKAARLPHWFSGDDHWPVASPARLSVIEALNDRFVALGDPESRARVGIGVATGADRIFITKDPTLVETDRLLPLAMVADTRAGELHWSGNYLVNPWTASGRLVDLAEYPKLAKYLCAHSDALAGRHVGRRQPMRWYRTIDKVDASLTPLPKLLFADMKLTSEPILDPGGHYPHHNLYFVVSDVWDLRVLGGLLISKVAEAFVDAYAVKMRGGTLRFQAQYLRRIRLPRPEELTAGQCEALAEAFDRRDVAVATEVALTVYGLTGLPD